MRSSRSFALPTLVQAAVLSAAATLAGCGGTPPGPMADPPLPSRPVRPWSQAHEVRDLEAEESAVTHAVYVFFLTRTGPLEEPTANAFFLSGPHGDPSDAVIASLRQDPEVRAVFGPRMPAIEKYSRWDDKKIFQGLHISVSSIAISWEHDLDLAYADAADLTGGLCCETLSFKLIRRGDGWVVWESRVEAII